MIKINKNSVTIAVYKRTRRFINKLLDYISVNTLAGLIVAITVFIFYVLSFVAYGTQSKDFASILLLTYIVISAGCCISKPSNGMIALLVFAIPMFLCLLTTTDAYSSNRCIAAEKKLQWDKDGTEYLQYWYKNNCGGK